MSEFLDQSDFQDVPLASTQNDELNVWEESNQCQVLDSIDDEFFNVAEIREIGRPEEMSKYWHFQDATMDCALYAQGSILEAMGQEFDINTYREQGVDYGWYDPVYGTYPEGMASLLEVNGVAVDCYTGGATIQNMAQCLSEGKGVLVAIDTEALWGEPGSHALWVTGIDVGTDGIPTRVICNDSGREDGCNIGYSFASFMNGWDSLDNFMIVTRDSFPIYSKGEL